MIEVEYKVQCISSTYKVPTGVSGIPNSIPGPGNLVYINADTLSSVFWDDFLKVLRFED